MERRRIQGRGHACTTAIPSTARPAPIRSRPTSADGSPAMIRTGKQYLGSIRDGRVVYINGEKVKDVTTHRAFKPLVDIRAHLRHAPREGAARGHDICGVGRAVR